MVGKLIGNQTPLTQGYLQNGVFSVANQGNSRPSHLTGHQRVGANRDPLCPQRRDLVAYCQAQGIVVEAYSPLGSAILSKQNFLLAGSVLFSLFGAFRCHQFQVWLTSSGHNGFLIGCRAAHVSWPTLCCTLLHATAELFVIVCCHLKVPAFAF